MKTGSTTGTVCHQGKRIKPDHGPTPEDHDPRKLPLAVATWTHVGGHGSASGTRGLFNAINKADTVKLILLAVFIAAATIAARRLQAFPRWVLWEGIIAVPVLVIGGLAFVIDAAALDLFLALSLVLVVVWAAAASITILRRVTPRQVSMP